MIILQVVVNLKHKLIRNKFTLNCISTFTKLIHIFQKLKSLMRILKDSLYVVSNIPIDWSFIGARAYKRKYRVLEYAYVVVNRRYLSYHLL